MTTAAPRDPFLQTVPPSPNAAPTARDDLRIAGAGMTVLTTDACARVAISWNQPCSVHSLEIVSVLGAIGAVDRIDERCGGTASS